MLLNLPIDILVEIALYLPIYDKFQLVLTCKRLKDAILERCLYETLEFDYEQEDTESIVLEFRKNQYKGKKVKVLRIDLDQLSNQLFGDIPLIFPNVVEFYDYSYESQARPEENCSGFIKWKDTLEYLRDGGGEKFGVVYKLLEKNVFSRLTTLAISKLKNDGGHIDFLECVKNAPALKNLTLREYTITLEVIETIHSKCPLLVAFKIDSCVILIREDETLPTEIVPTSYLSRFSLSYSGICDQQCVFLTYLTQKYTNLIKLEFNPDFSGYTLGSLFPEQDVEQLLSNPEYITRLNELNLTRESYNVSASEILSNLPSTLKLLHITSFIIQKAMTIFSKKCVNVARVDFFEETHIFGNTFSSPEDIKVLKNTPFLRNTSILFEPSIQEYKEAPASTSITQLKTIIKGTSPRNDMDIGWILSMFPSLNYLDIKWSGTRLVGYENNPRKTYPNLTRLSIGPSALHPNVMTFIHNTAPNLKHLHLWIIGKYLKERIEASHLDRSIVVQLDKPEMKNERPQYTIDLTGFSLDCFHLKVDLRETYDDNEENILLRLKNKGNTKGRFVITKGSRCVYLVNYCGEDLKEKIKAKITVRYDYTKTITVNSGISIDLEKSLVQLKYWG